MALPLYLWDFAIVPSSINSQPLSCYASFLPNPPDDSRSLPPH
jgi:hypothetical protein